MSDVLLKKMHAAPGPLLGGGWSLAWTGGGRAPTGEDGNSSFAKRCVTMRDETEWVELVEVGANQLVGAHPQRIVGALARLDSSDIRVKLYRDTDAAQKDRQALFHQTFPYLSS